MPTYKRFEDLPVWNLSADLAATIFDWTKQQLFRGQGDLANQLQRATLSISNNIAEGFERGSTAELLQFLYIARGSAGEVRSMLCVMERMAHFADLRSEISDLKSQFEQASRQIRGWADSLQNSDIKGQRHLNDQTRKQYEATSRQSEFRSQLEDFKLQQEERLNREARERAERREKEDKS